MRSECVVWCCAFSLTVISNPLALPKPRWQVVQEEIRVVFVSLLIGAAVRNKQRDSCNTKSVEIEDIRILGAVVGKGCKSWPLTKTPAAQK